MLARTSESDSLYYLEQERIARIETWLDGLVAGGCPPWNDLGDFLPRVEVGWFPVEAWTPYELYDFEGDAGTQRKRR